MITDLALTIDSSPVWFSRRSSSFVLANSAGFVEDGDRAGGEGVAADAVETTERTMGRQRVARDAVAFLKQNCIGTVKLKPRR